MLIIEGSDLVGKTTLCHTLLKKGWFQDNGYWYRHATKPTTRQTAADYFPHIAQKVIQDRFVLSEPVYATHVRNQKRIIDDEELRLLQARIAQCGGFTVVVIATESLIRQRYELHASREMYSVDMCIEANRGFELLANNPYAWGVDYVIRCDEGKPYPDEVDIEEIQRQYVQRFRTAERYSHFAGLPPVRSVYF